MQRMDSQAVQLLDLPDELLLIILKKLDAIDVLYLLFGLNKRLNKIVLTVAHTSQLFIMAQSSDWSSQFNEGYDIRSTLFIHFTSDTAEYSIINS